MGMAVLGPKSTLLDGAFQTTLRSNNEAHLTLNGTHWTGFARHVTMAMLAAG